MLIPIPETLLHKQHIVLGITGSIAAYKSLELIRLFIKAGASVQAIMTPAATKFIMPLSVETLTQNPVLLDDNESWSSSFNHIKITYDAALFCIAPCSINTLSKLSLAISDSILLQSALAFKGPFLIAPAANTTMIQNVFAQASLQRLKEHGYHLVDTQSKQLACLAVGDGALADVHEIFMHSARIVLSQPFWQNRHVVITGGGTSERIDDVRFIGNFSSGKMAASLALALYLLGADVTLIASVFAENLPAVINRVAFSDTTSLQHALEQEIKTASQKRPVLLMAAAVSDYRVHEPSTGKLKKEHLGENWQLKLTQNSDIIGSIDKSHCISVAFKAEYETSTQLNHAKRALASKGTDYIALNNISTHPFGSDTNAMTLIAKNGDVHPIKENDKLSIAFTLAEHIANDYTAS